MYYFLNFRWDEVIEILSVGFYNFYLKCYSDELRKEFESEKPCDKYTVYKKLSRIRRNTNKKYFFHLA